MQTFRNILLTAGCLITLVACNGPKPQQVVPIEKLRHTEFVPTLENNLVRNKNIVYAPAFLYAWDKVKHLFNFPLITSKSNSLDFRSLNQSASFRNTLNQDEYEAAAFLDDGEIHAEAFFHKDLPFASKLQKLDDGILFDKTRVAAFGMKDFDYKAVQFTHILFYKDDNNFILKLTPNDSLQEIILVKGLQDIKTFADAITNIHTLIEDGSREKSNPKDSWKYQFNQGDSYSIPNIKFNIEAHYKNIEGQRFSSGGKEYSIRRASQRTAFVLDENGAVVESAATITTDSVDSREKSHSKNLAFDKPFFIIIERVHKTSPYFAMKVNNVELLTKK